MWYQLLGVFIIVASTVVMFDRYGMPSIGLSFVYLCFGMVFVIFGIMVGQMHEVDTLSLLLLQKWGINLSLMTIGYAVFFTGFIGLATQVYRIFWVRK